jgi:hypothetical protein
VAQPEARQTGSGVTHIASDIVDGAQTCVRCGRELPTTGDGSGWTPGGLVENEFLREGEMMHAVRPGDPSRFPDCRPSGVA